MNKLLFLGLGAASLVCGVVAGHARDARACGGCFSPPRQVTVVTDHRMAFAVSPQQTVLWDQIEYSGAPQDFAWVLPVAPGAQIQLAHDQFFAALDALSDPVITGPTPQCGGGGAGCSSSSLNGSGSGAAFGPGGGSGVEVVSQSVIGPYDSVTVHSTDPNALYDWLQVNAYDVPDTIRPVIDAYVAGGFDFIALRLAPGQGVQAMQPVRVVSPGAGLTLPLRMVAAGVGAQVGITLYVISEGRYEAQNFSNATFDDSKLVWIPSQNASNYQTLSQSIMQTNRGRTWLTEFSGPVQADLDCATAGQYGTYYNGTYYGSNGATPDLGALYFSSCQCTGTGAAGPAPSGVDGGDSGEAAGSGDGGAGAGSCAAFDDLTVALAGMNPSTTWLTRMRALLPSDALSEGDLVLQASSSQAPVSNQHTALVYDDPTYDPCGGSGAAAQGSTGGGCVTGGGRTPVSWSRYLLLSAVGLLVVAVARRRRSARGRR
ncbi:MAG: DUF2330 domain-containing protein [Polyangiaceae bacterium]